MTNYPFMPITPPLLEDAPHHFYSLDQLHAFGRACIEAALEEAAKVVETCPVERYASLSHERQAKQQRASTAAAIRALARDEIPIPPT